MILLILLILVLVLLLFFIIKSINIVKETEVYVIERLGKFYKLSDAGITIILPFIDKIRCIVSLKEQTLGISVQNIISQDNIITNMDAIIFYSVIEPAKAVYEIQSLKKGIEYSAITTIHDVINKVPYDTIISSRDLINNQLRRELNDITYKWGTKVNSVKIQNIKRISK